MTAGQLHTRADRERQARLQNAEAIARREFPDLLEVHPTIYAGRVMVEVWREWDGVRGARMFEVTGEVL